MANSHRVSLNELLQTISGSCAKYVYENKEKISDMNEEEIKVILEKKDDFLNIWRTFNTENKPFKWIVWPHSKSKGWMEKIEKIL